MKSKSLVHSFFDEDADGKYRPKCRGLHYEEDGLNPTATLHSSQKKEVYLFLHMVHY